MLMAGSSGCGKSTLVTHMIAQGQRAFDDQPRHIVLCYSEMQDLYQTIMQVAPCPVTLVEGLPDNLCTQPGTLLVIDDLQGQKGKEVSQWFTKKSHHQQTSVIYLVQNMFDKAPEHRTISLNAHYLVVFKNPRDSSQIVHLSKQVYPLNPRMMVDAYRQATKRPHGYLFVDCKQGTDDLYRLKTDLFSSDHVPAVFVDANLEQDSSLVWHGSV